MQVDRLIRWWRQFIRGLDELVRKILYLFSDFTWLKFLGLLFGLWLLLMQIWVRNFSRAIQLIYWLMVLGYFALWIYYL